MAVLVLGGLLAAFEFGLGHDPRVVRPVVLDRPAPAERLERLGGGRMRIPVPGRPTVVNFWASWCPPCRAEFPLLHEAWSRWSKDVQFAGILYQDSPASARRFLLRMGDRPNGSYANLLDPGSRSSLDYGVYGLPETFFVDGNGVIRAKVIGQIDWAQLEQDIELITR